MLAAVLVAMLPGGTDPAYARADLWSLPAGRRRSRHARRSPRWRRARACKLRADHLPGPTGTAYELWCVRTDGRWVSGGSFRARADGTAAAELTAAVMPGEYHVMVVIPGARRGGERGAEVMRGKLDY